MAAAIKTRLLLICLMLLMSPACSRTESQARRPVLIVNAEGASRNSVSAIATILTQKGIAYDSATSDQLNGMTESEFMSYKLIIVPGGNYLTMGNSLRPETTQRVQNAVRKGVNYLGICAGGLLAGKAKCNSFNLTSGVTFGFYGIVNDSVHKSVVPIECYQTPEIQHYWEDGPQFTGWGLVVGKYPDGTPAIVEDTVGKGTVILCGVHPEAPESWRRGMAFATNSRAANAYAGTLIQAALDGTQQPHY